MNIKFWIPIFCFAILFNLRMEGQQLPLYSQYMMNGFLFNPAVAGSDGYTTLGISARDHWVGFDNSPKTSALSIQGRLLRRNYRIRHNSIGAGKSMSKRSGRVGLGGYLFSDVNGAIERVGGQISYAYHIHMQNTQLSFGLAASTFQFKLATDKLDPKEYEPLLDGSFSNKVLVPDLSAGTYVLSTDYYAGFSIANLFQTRIKLGGSSFDYRMYRHYFLMAGYHFKQESDISFEPSFLIKGTEKTGFQADLQGRIYYMQNYYAGLTFRTGTAIGIILGAKLNKLYISYAFDYTLTSIQRHTYGSHELNVAVKFGDSARRYRWLIRY